MSGCVLLNKQERRVLAKGLPFEVKSSPLLATWKLKSYIVEYNM